MHHFSKSPSVWIGPWSMLVIYIILNICCAFIPFIPGVGVFVFFGILAPVSLAVVHFAWIYGKRKETGYWKLSASAESLVYISLGALTLYFITQLWASV